MQEEARMNDRIASMKRLLQDHGLSVTTARIAVLQALQDGPAQGHGHEHRSAEEIRASVLAYYPVINVVTVYRTLESFEEHGLADRVTLGDKLVRWGQATHAHHHMVCRECGRTIELAAEPFQRLADELDRSYGVRVDIRHLALRGLCPSCSATGHDPRGEARQAASD